MGRREPYAVRLLIVDRSGILPWRVGRAAPLGTRVQVASSLREAARCVCDDPPDAVVVSVPRARLPWAQFQRLCAGRHPPVPVLYESCLEEGALEASLAPAGGSALFLPKPSSPSVLRQALAVLLAAARSGGASFDTPA